MTCYSCHYSIGSEAGLMCMKHGFANAVCGDFIYEPGTDEDQRPAIPSLVRWFG